VIKPEEIVATEIEYALLGYVVNEKDHNLLLRLDESLFATDVTKKLYKHMLSGGIQAPQIMIHNFKDRGDKGLADAVEESLRQNMLTDVSDVEDYIRTLEDKKIRRSLCEISIDIQDSMLADPYFTIQKIDSKLGNVFSAAQEHCNTGDKKFLKTYNALTSGAMLGIPTGIDQFDELTGGVVRGNVISVGGITGNMKSTSTLAIVRSTLKANPDLRAIFFQLEMTGRDMSILISGQNGVNKTDLLKGSVPMTDVMKKLMVDPVERQFDFYSAADDRVFSFKDIERIVLKFKPDIWIIDYFGQLVQNESMVKNRNYDNHNAYFMQTMHLIKVLTHRTNSICFLIHQADAKLLKQRMADPRPKMADIEWSQNILHLSGFVYLCYYPYMYYPTVMTNKWDRLFIQIWEKVRYGKKTYIIYEVDPQTGIFSAPSEEVYALGMTHWLQMNSHQSVVKLKGGAF